VRTLLLVACACSAEPVTLPDAGVPAEEDAGAIMDEDAGTVALPTFVGSWGGYGREPGQFVEPSSVELDSDHFVWVAGHEDRIQKFTTDGELVAIYGVPGNGDGQFNHPHGLAIDRMRGDLVYVGDQENHRVQVFRSDGTFIRRWTDDQFKHIHDVGIDPSSGDIYVGDYDLDVLQKFTAQGELIAELGNAGREAGQFDGVWGISTDSAGNVYVADTFNRRVQKLDPNGAFLEEWRGSPLEQFRKPTGVFVDAEDIVHVCDSLAQLVLRFDTDGRFIDQWFLRDIIGDDSEPEDIVIDAAGEHIYIGEVLRHRVLHLIR
jgi:DNA-binding beta-propeller fold protein YncE